MRLECDVCGFAACDMPDGFDPELFFEVDGNVEHCPTCDPSDAPFIIRNDGPAGAGWEE